MWSVFCFYIGKLRKMAAQTIFHVISGTICPSMYTPSPPICKPYSFFVWNYMLYSFRVLKAELLLVITPVLFPVIVFSFSFWIANCVVLFGFVFVINEFFIIIIFNHSIVGLQFCFCLFFLYTPSSFIQLSLIIFSLCMIRSMYVVF